MVSMAVQRDSPYENEGYIIVGLFLIGAVIIAAFAYWLSGGPS